MPRKREDGEEPKESAPKKAAKRARTKAAAKKTAAKKAAPAKAAAKKSAPAKPEAKTTPAGRSKAVAKKTSTAKQEPGAKPRRAAKKNAAEGEGLPTAELAFVDDAVGDVSDGEAHRLLVPEAESSAAMMEAYRADTTAEAEHGIPQMEPEPAHEERARRRAVGRAAEAREAAPSQAEGEAEGATKREPGPEPKLERLQKILSQAGVASRRHAEEMIVAGRVMVNGQMVTQLGAKADPVRDHIRVDGKLLEGAERHRTFLLNKPKGYVTTVSDPEGRPTVMEFFSNLRERLYPVGRLDFQSEGLLLMSNDGELANLLTRAASGVEKTYLVKVSGQPSEGELEQLRGGVMIEREQAGSGRVRTAPASVRQIRPGDNPWFEVVLTEGRNRELRKMFHAVGHFVEKIRRVGYGPLVLDVEPGKFRELSAEELNALRLTAEGKLKPRRPKSNAMLPKEAGRSAERDQERVGRQGRDRQEEGRRPRGDRPFRRDNRTGGDRGGFAERSRPTERSRPGERGGFEKRRLDSRPQRREFGRGERGGFERPYNRPFNRPSSEQPPAERGGRRERRDEDNRDRDRFNRPWPERGTDRGTAGFGRREERFGGERRERGERPRPYGGGREQRGEFGGRPRFDRPQGNRPRFERPGSERPERGNRGEAPREERRQGEFRPRREFRSREEGGERRQRAFGGDRPGGGQHGGQRNDKGGREGQRFGDKNRDHGGRPGFGGGFRNKRGGGPRRERS